MVYHKVRKYRREVNLKKRQMNMSTMIMRNFRAHHARKMESIKLARETKALEAVEVALDPVCDFWIQGQVEVVAHDLLIEEVAEDTTNKELDALIDIIFGDIATQAGMMRMQEQLEDLEEERLRMEAERLIIEKEQIRIEQAQHSEELAEFKKTMEEKKVMEEYQKIQKPG